MEGVIGQIILFAGNFPPRSWEFCHGQLLSIAQNSALFSILGTTYGGNGVQTFALPDLRGRVPRGVGQAPGIGNVNLGETGGSENTILGIHHLPQHSHALKANNQFSGGDHPAGKYFGASSGNKGSYADTGNTVMAPDVVAPAGGNQPFSNLEPFLGLNYIICVQGYFPSRA